MVWKIYTTLRKNVVTIRLLSECSRKLIFQGGALGKNAILLKDKSMTFERTRVQNESRTDSKFFSPSFT